MAASSRAGVIDWPTFAGQLVLIVLAMFFARSAAMLANRILDARFDAENPRTASRAIPSGRLPAVHARIAWGVTAMGFLGVCLCFGLFYGNWWPVILGLPVIGWISLYGLAKRFTQFCHVWLGSSLAMSPLAAAIAIDPTSLAAPAIWLLAVMVLFWVAGFDIIYALQDVDIDRRDGLFSMPGQMGSRRALHVALAMHVVAIIALFGVALTAPDMGSIMFAAACVVTGLLLYEHLTVRRWGTTKIALVFFTLNGVVSCLIGLAGIIDVTVV